MELEKQKVLITGGAGYIGSILSRLLLEDGHDVTIIDRLLFGEQPIRTLHYFYPDLFHLVRADIRDQQVLTRTMKDKDIVIHLAAIVGDPACSVKADEAVETNVTATDNIAALADKMGVGKFIFSSTCSVYGASEQLLDEESIAKPVSLYGQTKLNAESHLINRDFKNLQVSILRLGTVFGLSPRMRFDLVVNYLSQKAIVDRSIKILGGEQWRPFLHVRDAAMAFKMFALNENVSVHSGEIYNIGSNENNLQIATLGDILQDVFPWVKVEVVAEARDHRSYRVKFSKLAERTGFTPRLGLKEAIHEIRDAIMNGTIIDPSKAEYYNYRVWD